MSTITSNKTILQLRMRALSALAVVAGCIGDGLTIRESTETHEVKLVVTPAGEEDEEEKDRIPGRMLNDLEMLVWMALGSEPRPLSAQAIANRIRRKLDNRLKYTLIGLVGRGVLVASTDANQKLYARAPN